MSVSNKTDSTQSIAAKTPFAKSQDVLSIAQDVQVISATDEVFNHVDGNEPMWSGDGDRHVDIAITFEKPFQSTPAIQAGLSGVDCDHEVNLRFNVECRDVTGAGFTLRFLTWGDTHIARACVSWNAVGQTKQISSGSGTQTPSTSKSSGPTEVRSSAVKSPPVSKSTPVAKSPTTR